MTTLSSYSFRFLKLLLYINFQGRILAPSSGRCPGAAAPPAPLATPLSTRDPISYQDRNLAWWSYESDRYICLAKISMAQILQKGLQLNFNMNCCLTLLNYYLLLYIKQYHLHDILNFNVVTKFLCITYHFLLRYDILP